jgi:hypothetical protein
MRRSERRDRDRDFGEGDLDLAIRAGGCPACTLAGQTEDVVLGWLVRENLRDRQTVANLARSGGLCGLHWSAVLRRADSRTGRWVARAISTVANQAVEQLSGAAAIGAPRCPVCAAMQRRTRGAAEMVLGRLDDLEAREDFARSFGLCQPHASVALDLAADEGRRRRLLEIQRGQLHRLHVGLESATGEESIRAAARTLAAKLAGSSADPGAP